MAKIDHSKIEELLANLSVDNDTHKIKFNMIPVNSSQVREENGTKLYDLRAMVDVELKEDGVPGEKISFAADLLKLPHYGETAFTVKGKSKQVISKYTLSYGWYIMEDHLKLTTERGPRLLFYTKNYQIFVTTGKKPGDKGVPLGVFLKAFTGSSYSELAKRIGPDNVYVMRSFAATSEEPLRSECIDMVVTTLLKDYSKEEKVHRYFTQGMSERFDILAQRFLNGQKMYLGNTSGIRLKRSVSFKYRGKNMYLAKTIKVNGEVFEKDLSLEAKHLDALDYLPVDELPVYSSDKKKHILRKNSVYSFRALGCTLEEDVDVEGYIIPKGTVLDIADLRRIDSTSLDKIAISFDGKKTVCSRKLFDGSFKIDDTINILQVFVDSLNGMNLIDDIYDLTNQNLDTLDIRAASLLKENCNQLISHILDSTLTYRSGQDLLSKVLAMRPLDTDGLIRYIEDVETKESQQAEINNIVQKLSKEKRIAKDVKRTSPGMVSVQQSQFNKIDPIESPESSKIGAVQSLAYYSKTNEYGFLASVLLPVKNGVVTSTVPVYLTAEEEEGEFIAQFNETFHEELPDGTLKKKETVLAMSSKTFLEVPTDDVRYIQVGPFDGMSPSRMLSPFPEHSQPKRLLMNANQNKQAVPLINNRRPLVSSGGESLLAKEGIVEARDILKEYWKANKSSINESEEAFCQRRIKLEKTQMIRNYRVLSFSIEGIPGGITQYEIPYMQKAASGSMFSYEINTATDLVYCDRDVVAHSSDIDIRPYKVEKHANFGRMDIDDTVFERAIALSTNLVVVYKTHGSSTIDDSVLISDRLVTEDFLTTRELHVISYELQPEKHNSALGTLEEESFGFINEPPTRKIDVTGLAKYGEFLDSGDIAICVKVEKKEASRTEGLKVVDQNPIHVTVGDTVHGQVVYSAIEGNVATVVLASLKPIEQGDKIAGRHGNKGVVARILPHHLMPYDSETGQVADIVLNPLGIPSRMNISQMLEVTLGMCALKSNTVQIVTPFVGDTLAYVKEMANKLDVKPKMLRDGRTGKYFARPMLVGVIYPIKLEHMVDHKIKSVGISSSLDPVFNQPSKGGGGQAIGEMESWALGALGMTKTAQDLYSTQSDDLIAINELRQEITADPTNVEVEGNNNNDHLFQVITRCLGSEPTYDEDGALWFKPLTDTLTKSLSMTPIDINNKASLESADYFGVTSNTMRKFENRTTWSWMPLHCEIVHPFYIVKGNLNKKLVVHREYEVVNKKTNLTEIKTKVTLATEDILRDLIACRGSLEHRSRDQFYYHEGKNAEFMTGMPALVYWLRNYDLAITKDYLRSKLENAKSDNSITKYLTQISDIEGFEQTGATLEDFVITTLPIMPLAFRPKAKFAHILQDFDFYYSRIIDEVVKYNSSSVKTPEGIYNVYLRIVEFCGLTYGSEVQPNKSYKPLIKYFTGREGPDSKHGRFRESMLKKRSLFAGRTVIVPQSDIKRPPTKIGLPFRMVVKALELHLTHLLRKTFSSIELSAEIWRSFLTVIAKNRTAFNDLVKKHEYQIGMTHEEFYEKVYGVIQAFVEGFVHPETGEVVMEPQIVLAGRQPTLHKFGIRAYEVVIVHGKCIEIHPLVTKGYNADFDGDQMHIEFLVNKSAQKEAREKASPMYGLINPKDGSLILEPTQDIRLGVYFATMLWNNVDSIEKDDRYKEQPHFYWNLDTLETDVDLGLVAVHSLVVFNHNDRLYLSTAGRILFNGLMPDNAGFTDAPFSNPLNIPDIKEDDFCDLRFDGLISGNGGSREEPVYKSLGKILRWSIKFYDKQKNLEFVQKISEFGFTHSDYSGLSLSLDDLVENPKTDLYLERAKEYAEVINDRYFKGVISEAERKEEIIYLYKQTKDRIRKTFMLDFDRNNNLFIMFDSGARGNEDQIMQTVGVIGILQKTKDEVLETPVLTNYTRGVTPYEMLQLSYSARVGVASTQNETANSGEATRLAAYMAQGFKIVEEDCGFGARELKLWWGDPTGMSRTPEGKLLNASEAFVGKRLGDDPVAKEVLLNFLEEGDLVSDRTLSMMFEKKLQRVVLEDGVYELLYKPDTLMMSLLEYREAEGLPHLIDGKFIGKDTLDSIVQDNLETIKVRTMMSCGSVGGTCQHCYGLAYDTGEMPAVGTLIGFETAESVGEPTAQLSMSLFHGGGEAGKSADKGVELYSSTLNTGFSKKIQKATLARYSGYVEIDSDRKRPFIVSLDGTDKQIHYCHTELIVEPGEYVEKNEPISMGFAVPQLPVTNISDKELQFVQLSLLNIHFRIFETNNIKVYARHFELFVREQTSLVKVLHSNHEDFKPGRTYERNAILRKGAEVESVFSVSTAREVIEHFGGVETLLAHADLATGLGKAVSSGKKSKVFSFIGRLAQGQPLYGEPKKVFTVPKMIAPSTNTKLTGDEDQKVAMILLESDYVTEIETVNATAEDIDWGDMFGGDFADVGSTEVEVTPEVVEPTKEASLDISLDFNDDEDEIEGKETNVKQADAF